MKKTTLLILTLCLMAITTAQALTVASTAGGLSTAITTAGGNPSTITNLTVTGTIDARDFSTMASLYYLSVIDLSGATIASYTGAGSVYPANGIPINAFYQCGRLTSVIIPSSVTSIGGGAFYECEDFTSINIPSSVTYIGDEAFDGCTALTSVTFSIPSSLTSIGYKTFMDCSLTSVTIPSSVTSIGNDAFVYCNGLITVDANNPNYSSADGVLFNKAKTTLIQCPISKTGSYVIPSSVDSIGNYAFYWCTNLTSITIPSSVTFIGEGAFYECTALTSITIPSSVTSIGDNVFGYCSSFTSINIPSSVTFIGDGAFQQCWRLTSINIPSSVTSIGADAFKWCTGLTSVTIPASVTSIGADAFLVIDALITVDANNPNYSSADGVLFNKNKTTLIQCPTSKTGNYAIPSSVTSIGGYAFACCGGLTSITIPSSVTSIGDSVFYECQNLTSITIPSSVTSIGGMAFGNCTSLTSIYAYPTTPVDLNYTTDIIHNGDIPPSDVFYNVNKTTCTLYVPANSVSLYQTAYQWQDFYNIIPITTTATQQIKDNITIYPNPVINNFNISGLSAPQTLQLFDLNGKLILSQQVDNGTVPASFLQTGIYILKIGDFETKIIKK